MKKLYTEKKSESGDPVIILQGDLTINEIIEYRNIILEKIESGDSFRIDLSEINKIDTAGLQLLLSARNKSNEDNTYVELINPSSEVDRIFDLYGLECVPSPKVSRGSI